MVVACIQLSCSNGFLLGFVCVCVEGMFVPTPEAQAASTHSRACPAKYLIRHSTLIEFAKAVGLVGGANCRWMISYVLGVLICVT